MRRGVMPRGFQFPLEWIVCGVAVLAELVTGLVAGFARASGGGVACASGAAAMI